MNDTLKILSGSAHPTLTASICENLGVPQCAATLATFPDGETFVQINENVRGRDVFIDHVADATVIQGQLATIEHFARHFGYAIAIGHPRPRTLDALEAWLPTLAAKGFALWPISAAVALRNRMTIALTV